MRRFNYQQYLKDQSKVICRDGERPSEIGIDYETPGTLSIFSVRKEGKYWHDKDGLCFAEEGLKCHADLFLEGEEEPSVKKRLLTLVESLPREEYGGEYLVRLHEVIEMIETELPDEQTP